MWNSWFPLEAASGLYEGRTDIAGESEVTWYDFIPCWHEWLEFWACQRRGWPPCYHGLWGTESAIGIFRQTYNTHILLFTRYQSKIHITFVCKYDSMQEPMTDSWVLTRLHNCTISYHLFRSHAHSAFSVAAHAVSKWIHNQHRDVSPTHQESHG